MVPVLDEAPHAARVVAAKKVERASILLATDGTAQSEQAVSAAGLIARRVGSDVDAITVVDQLPIPWSVPDAAMAAEYERRLEADALKTVRLQVDQFGERD